jgi:hypothetical protein
MTDFARMWRERQEAVAAYHADKTEGMDAAGRVKEIELRIAEAGGQDAVLSPQGCLDGGSARPQVRMIRR